MARICCHGPNDVLLHLLWRKRGKTTWRDGELDPPVMVPRTDHKQELVAPSQPVYEPGKRAERAIEQAISDPDGKVDDGNARSDRR